MAVTNSDAPTGPPPAFAAESFGPERRRFAITELTAAEQPEAAEVLAIAFRDNPMNRAVIRSGPRRRQRCNRLGMRLTLGAVQDAALVLLARDEKPPSESTHPGGFGPVKGVLLSAPPYCYPLPRAALGAQLRCMLGQGFAVGRRWSRVYQALEEVHPRQPHWYLGVLGVDPPQQGRGVGRSLLRHWLRCVDEGRDESYLETDREDNLRFYSRHGFEVVRELRLLDVPIWCMRRPPAMTS